MDSPVTPDPEPVDEAALVRTPQHMVRVEEPVGPDPYYGAGMLNLTTEQQDALMAKIDPTDLDITPDGNIYLPQLGYRKILFKVFGPGNWALVPMSDPKPLPPVSLGSKDGVEVFKHTIAQKFQLRVYGKYVAEAWGDGDYISTNKANNRITAAEMARSNALVRCCKDLGVAMDCWDKKFVADFKTKYCVQNNYKWTKKR